MLNLIIASLLWAFSFGLIKGRLEGLDPVTVAAGRLFLASLVFAPFILKFRFSRVDRFRTMLLGALQFGLMYWFYLASFQYLPAWLVALFTVFTPLYVVLISDILARRLRWRNLIAALVAVAGALLVVAHGLPGESAWQGVLLLQGANLCFAAGQTLYPGLKKKIGADDVVVIGWMHWGAFLITGLAVLLGPQLELENWTVEAGLTLLYLGLIPTAAGFYLWNRGAARVSSGWLAVANNLKIPLAVVVSWLVFGEEADRLRAVLGLAVVVGGLFLVNPGRDDLKVQSGTFAPENPKRS